MGTVVRNFLLISNSEGLYPISNGVDRYANKHRKNSPLIRIDGDAVQLQRTEYGRCQTDVELHGVRLAVR